MRQEVSIFQNHDVPRLGGGGGGREAGGNALGCIHIP